MKQLLSVANSYKLHQKLPEIPDGTIQDIHVSWLMSPVTRHIPARASLAPGPDVGRTIQPAPAGCTISHAVGVLVYQNAMAQAVISKR